MQNGLRSVRQELAFIPNREQTFLSLHLETNIFSRSLLSFFTEGAKNTWFDHSPVNFHKTDFCVRNQHDRTQNANFRATVGLVWGGSAHWRRRAMLRCCCLLMRVLVDAWKTLNCSCSLDPLPYWWSRLSNDSRSHHFRRRSKSTRYTSLHRLASSHCQHWVRTRGRDDLSPSSLPSLSPRSLWRSPNLRLLEKQ